jgi:hypothetical protein
MLPNIDKFDAQVCQILLAFSKFGSTTGKIMCSLIGFGNFFTSLGILMSKRLSKIAIF